MNHSRTALLQEVCVIIAPHALNRFLRRRPMRGLLLLCTLAALGTALYPHAAHTQGTEDPTQSKIQNLKSKIPTPPVIHAACAILIDAVSGQVLYVRNADKPRPMASTTKIMTALLFAEHVSDTDLITASPYACATRESSLHLKPGEKLTGHDMLRAILMRSANDGCVAAAEHVAGSEEAFVAMMNARARELGATHTHFMNPHGLHHPLHYTTARDLALIARAAMQNPRIAAVTCCKRCVIQRSINKRDVSMRNHSRFLGAYPGADGVKTGWTVPAGKCYVGSATHNGWRLISVVLKCPDYVHETAKLMSYGFRNYEPHILARPGDAEGISVVNAGQQPSVPIAVKSKLQVVLPKGDFTLIESHLQVTPLTAPVQQGAMAGTLEARIHGKTICSAPLITTQSVAAAPDTARLSLHSTQTGSRFWLVSGIFAAGLVSLRYGNRVAAFTKMARRRGRRLAKSLRSPYR